MEEKNCRGRHYFVIDKDRQIKSMDDFRYLWKCERCGYAMDKSVTDDEYKNSYYGRLSTSWDPDNMYPSEIDTFRISYVIGYDRYQIIDYSSGKLVYKKTWGTLNPRCGWAEKAEDWEKSIECILSEEEDRKIRQLLESTDFVSWGTNIEKLMCCLRGTDGCNDMPGFECTFRDHPYKYFRVFFHNYHPGRFGAGKLQFGDDYYFESDFVSLLQEICNNHNIDLPRLYLSIWD